MRVSCRTNTHKAALELNRNSGARFAENFEVSSSAEMGGSAMGLRSNAEHTLQRGNATPRRDNAAPGRVTQSLREVTKSLKRER